MHNILSRLSILEKIVVFTITSACFKETNHMSMCFDRSFYKCSIWKFELNNDCRTESHNKYPFRQTSITERILVCMMTQTYFHILIQISNNTINNLPIVQLTPEKRSKHSQV
jgi:hypothetical protein